MKQMINENHTKSLNDIGRVINTIQQLAATILSIVVFADGILERMLGEALFFGGVPPSYKVAIGFITIVLTSKKS